jgi:hypothetical protein
VDKELTWQCSESKELLVVEVKMFSETIKCSVVSIPSLVAKSSFEGWTSGLDMKA